MRASSAAEADLNVNNIVDNGLSGVRNRKGEVITFPCDRKGRAQRLTCHFVPENSILRRVDADIELMSDEACWNPVSLRARQIFLELAQQRVVELHPAEDPRQRPAPGGAETGCLRLRCKIRSDRPYPITGDSAVNYAWGIYIDTQDMQEVFTLSDLKWLQGERSAAIEICDDQLAVSPVPSCSDASEEGGSVCTGWKSTSAGEKAAHQSTRSEPSVASEVVQLIDLFAGQVASDEPGTFRGCHTPVTLPSSVKPTGGPSVRPDGRASKEFQM